jgi:predicted nucleotidyltransferase
MEDEFGNIGRVETFKKDRYPEFIGSEGTAKEQKLYRKLTKILPEIQKEAKSLMGDNLIGIFLIGGYAKGYATEKSDVDFNLVVRKDDPKVSEVINLMEKKLMRRVTRRSVTVNYFKLSNTIHDINNVDHNSVIPYWPPGRRVLALFYGKPLGNDEVIENTRKEIIQELAKSPDGKEIWDEVRRLYKLDVAGLVRSGFENREPVEYAPMKLGISREDFEEIVKARERFALPLFEEMKRKYGVG